MSDPRPRRIIYTSIATPPVDEAGMNAILAQSRHNNGIDGVSGLLWSDGTRFAQLLEGPADSVSEAMGRIRDDPRHADLTILVDRDFDERIFPDWSMAYAPAGRLPDHLLVRLTRLSARGDTEAAPFLDLILPREQR